MDARLVIVFLVFTAATSSRLVYLLFFHPLASFPGPRLAAVTRLWLFFYEIRGCGHQKIAELHQELGKSVRIGPDELSFLDVDTYYDEVYTQSTKFMKEPRFYRAFDNPGASLFTRTMRFDHASMKRLMSHAFSRSNVIALVPMLHRNTHAWISKLKSHVSKNGKIPLWHATQCLTLDNASCFSYGSAEGAIESDDFHHPLFKGFDNFAPMVVVFQHFPWMQTLAHLILHHIPAFRSINRGSATGFDRLRHTRVPGKEGLIMFESMLMKADKSRVILKADETISEGALMLVAGTGTTAAALTTAIYHLTRRPEIWKELRSQISSALSESSNHIDVVQLESVALLKAVIMESLRVAVPIRGRHPRVVPQGGWRYDGKILPHGIVVSSAPLYYCSAEKVFPNHGDFLPSRWLQTDSKKLDRYNPVFSAGTRSCIGQNLAMIELHLALAMVVLEFDPDHTVDSELQWIEYGVATPTTKVEVMLKLHKPA